MQMSMDKVMSSNNNRTLFQTLLIVSVGLLCLLVTVEINDNGLDGLIKDRLTSNGYDPVNDDDKYVESATAVVFKDNNTKLTLKYMYIGNPDMCHTPRDNTTQFTTIIFSGTAFLKRRQRLRDLIKKQLKVHSGKKISYSLKYQFIFGKPLNPNDALNKLIDKEHEQYGDVIQGDFIDTYRNLPMKSLFSFHWLKTNCAKHEKQYLLQLDDDIDFNIDTLYRTFVKPKDQHWIMGLINWNVGPIRDPLHKWGALVEEYPKDKYPSYAVGFAFIMPMSTVPLPYNSILKTPIFFIEDVYITGICRENAGPGVIKIIPNRAVCHQRKMDKRYCFACHKCS